MVKYEEDKRMEILINTPFKVDLNQTEHDSTILEKKSILCFKNRVKQLHKVILWSSTWNSKRIYRSKGPKTLSIFLTIFSRSCRLCI